MSQETEPNWNDCLGHDKLLVPTNSVGIYGRTETFEMVVAGIDTALTSFRPENARVRNHPPVMSRGDLERNGYLEKFRNLAASLHGFASDHASSPSDDSCLEEGTDLVMTPAACYPIYPSIARQGPIPLAGLVFDTSCYCFRKEPSSAVDRFQAFRMREFVMLGNYEATVQFRNRLIPIMQEFLIELGLDAKLERASDPFFGRMAPIFVESQLGRELKFELQVPIHDPSRPTAVMSFNSHLDMFGTIWDIRDTSGSIANSACFGAGIERLALALFRRHGMDLSGWPKSVLQSLQLDPSGLF